VKSRCIQGEPIGVLWDRVRGAVPLRGEHQERVPQCHRKEMEAWNEKGRKEEGTGGI